MIKERLELEVVGVDEYKESASKGSCHLPKATTTDSKSSIPNEVTTPSIVLTFPLEEGNQSFELHPPQVKSHSSFKSNSSLSLISHGMQSSLHHLQSPILDSFMLLPASVSTSSSHSTASPSTNTNVGTVIEEPLVEDGEICIHDFEAGDDKELSHFTASHSGRKKQPTNPEIGFEPMSLFNAHKSSNHSRWSQRSNSCPEPQINSDKVSLFNKVNILETMDEDTDDTVADTVDSSQGATNPMFSVGKVSDVLLRAKQWRKRAQNVKAGVGDQDRKGRCTFSEHVRKRALTEVPRALHLEILEESYPILQNTLEMYKGAMGNTHPLTVKAEKKIQQVEVKLGIDRAHLI